MGPTSGSTHLLTQPLKQMLLERLKLLSASSCTLQGDTAEEENCSMPCVLTVRSPLTVELHHHQWQSCTPVTQPPTTSCPRRRPWAACTQKPESRNLTHSLQLCLPPNFNARPSSLQSCTRRNDLHTRTILSHDLSLLLFLMSDIAVSLAAQSQLVCVCVTAAVPTGSAGSNRGVSCLVFPVRTQPSTWGTPPNVQHATAQ